MTTETHQPLSPTGRETLLDVALQSIRHGMEKASPLKVSAGDYDYELRELRSTFVTLNRQGDLRGCIGHLEATLPLVEDVAENAFSAAFRDPRFPPLSEVELDDLEIHISVLTPPEALACESEADLLARLRPNTDGLILADGLRRGTFLPSVWEQLPEPAEFLRHLKRKAGMPDDYWSDNMKVYRYETESFP